MSFSMNFYHEKMNDIVAQAREMAGERTIVKVKPVHMEICLESYPCQGHGGIDVTLSDGEQFRILCSSPAIGAAYKAFIPPSEWDKTALHFTEYCDGWEVPQQ